MKRLDPDLPFFYYTTSQHHYYEGEMPNFSVTPTKPKVLKRPPRRELVGSIGPRVSLPVRGSLSVRATFHNAPVDLPPLPSLSCELQMRTYMMKQCCINVMLLTYSSSKLC